MLALDRQGWILVGFGVLFFSAIVVSVCGWVLWWRTRRPHATLTVEAAAPEDDGRGDLEPPIEPEPEPVDEDAPVETPSLPPGNPLR